MFAVTVSSSALVLAGAVFLAAAVEMVEALTIVVAVGHTRGWRSALEGSAAALGVLTVLVAALGPALVRVPLDALRLVVGGVLLIFGLQWLRKAVLRSSGWRALHDEDAIYQAKVRELEGLGASPGRDHAAFVMAFKGVFLEGLEVVIAVLTLGTSAHRLGLAVVAALVAVILVGAVGAGVSRQLSAVPENAMKTVVGILLTSFGTFWTGEGLRIHWPGSDTMLLGFVAIYAVVVWVLATSLRARRRSHEVAA